MVKQLMKQRESWKKEKVDEEKFNAKSFWGHSLEVAEYGKGKNSAHKHTHTHTYVLLVGELSCSNVIRPYWITVGG